MRLTTAMSTDGDGRRASAVAVFSAFSSRIDLPPEPNRPPDRSAQRDPDSNQRCYRWREIRIDHEDQAGDELRPPVLFLAIDEQHETDAARDERQKQPGGVDRHAADDTALSTGPPALRVTSSLRLM